MLSEIVSGLFLFGIVGSGGAAGVGLMHWNRDRQAAIMLMSLPLVYILLFILFFFTNEARTNKIVANFNNNIIENTNTGKTSDSQLNFKEIKISDKETKIELKEESISLCRYFVNESNKRDVYETKEKHIKYEVTNIVVNEGKGCFQNKKVNNIQYTLSRK